MTCPTSSAPGRSTPVGAAALPVTPQAECGLCGADLEPNGTGWWRHPTDSYTGRVHAPRVVLTRDLDWMCPHHAEQVAPAPRSAP